MSSHKRTLGMFWDHPISANIEWKDVIHMLNQIGTTSDAGHDGLRVTVNGRTVVFHHAYNKTLSMDQVQQMRHFLAEVGMERKSEPPKGP